MDFNESLGDIRKRTAPIHHLTKDISLQKAGKLQPSLKYIHHLLQYTRIQLEESRNRAKSPEEKNAIDQTGSMVDDETKKIVVCLKQPVKMDLSGAGILYL